MSETAVPDPESRACACSTPRRRAGRLPCVLPSPALPPPGPMSRKWSRVICSPWREDARAREVPEHRSAWIRECEHPFALPDGATLATLRDAAHFIPALPDEEAAKPE